MSGTLHYPDIYSGDAGINFYMSYTVVAKATQGTDYVNPEYAGWKVTAAKENVYFVGYHFLEQGNAAAQAEHCFAMVGRGVPLMLDIESTTGSYPSLNDAVQFIEKYRSLGGAHSYLSYLPHWYWQDQWGSPNLDPLKAYSQWLVTSDYTTYSDNGPGWNGYGGLGVAAWQYSSTVDYGGVSQVDFNAFKGTGSDSLEQTLREFDRLVKTGHI